LAHKQLEMVISLKNGKFAKEILSNYESDKKVLIRWVNSCILYISYWQGNNVSEKLKVNVCSQLVNISSTENNIFPVLFRNCEKKSMNTTTSKLFLTVPRVRRRRLQTKARIKIPVDVKLCGRPETESTVYADVIKMEGDNEIESNIRFKAIPSYIPGKYEVKLPVSSTISTSLKQRICKSFKKTSRRLCSDRRNVNNKSENISDGQIQQCHLLPRIFQQNNVTNNFSAVNITDICVLGIKRVDLLCVELTDLIQANNCEDYFNTFDNFYTDQNTPIVFSAYFTNGQIIKSPVYNIFAVPISSAMGNTKTQVVLEGSDSILQILNFTVSPKHPKSNQRYKVTMHYTCARNTTKVHMLIEGSDNYSNYVTCYGIQRCNCCVLHVAAATGHVTDNVIVNVSDATLSFQFKKQFFVTN